MYYDAPSHRLSWYYWMWNGGSIDIHGPGPRKLFFNCMLEHTDSYILCMFKMVAVFVSCLACEGCVVGFSVFSWATGGSGTSRQTSGLVN